MIDHRADNKKKNVHVVVATISPIYITTSLVKCNVLHYTQHSSTAVGLFFFFGQCVSLSLQRCITLHCSREWNVIRISCHMSFQSRPRATHAHTTIKFFFVTISRFSQIFFSSFFKSQNLYHNILFFSLSRNSHHHSNYLFIVQ